MPNPDVCSGNDPLTGTARVLALLGRFAPLRCALGIALAALTANQVGLGQNPSVLELHWDAPSQCPQSDVLQERIRALVGSTEVRPEQLRAEGRITRIEDKYHLVMLVRSGSAVGIRELDSDSCDHLTGAAAVALGLLVRRARSAATPLSSEVLGAPPQETGEPSADRPPTDESHNALSPSNVDAGPQPGPQNNATRAPPAVAHQPPTSNAAGSTRKLKGLLRAPSVEIGLGSLPGLSAGYAIGAGVSYEAWQAVLTGVLWPQRTVHSQWPGFGVEVTRYSLALDGCRAWRSGRLEWAPCVHTGLVKIVASGTGPGILPVKSNTSVWSAGASFETKLRFAPWVALLLAVTGELQTTRPRLVTKEIGEIYRFPIVGLKFGLGSEWLF